MKIFTIYDLDSSSCDLIPNILPIGPLLIASNHTQNSCFSGSICLDRLERYDAGSVVYVSSGSLAARSYEELAELALGLELSQ